MPGSGRVHSSRDGEDMRQIERGRSLSFQAHVTLFYGPAMRVDIRMEFEPRYCLTRKDCFLLKIAREAVGVRT
jgi:hypothetical protein